LDNEEKPARVELGSMNLEIGLKAKYGFEVAATWASAKHDHFSSILVGNDKQSSQLLMWNITSEVKKNIRPDPARHLEKTRL
jgi:hypothetical protein